MTITRLLRPQPLPMRMQDKDYIARLHPKVRDAATKALEAATIALTGSVKPIITFALRTWAEQQALYDQGRNGHKGEIVTNAGPGQSYHNYGLALDFALQATDFKLVWDINKDFDLDHVADWMEVVRCFKTEGFSWGGNWKSFKDYPHFELTFGYNWSQLSAMYSAKKFIPGTTYLNI